MEQRTGAFLLDSFGMYMDRVYRLQLEFSEISQKLARSQMPEDRHQLSQRRVEIIAEASELVYTLDTTIPVQHLPARSSRLIEAFGISSE
jgi:hypothetical protein